MATQTLLARVIDWSSLVFQSKRWIKVYSLRKLAKDISEFER